MKKCKITLAPKAKQRFFYLALDADVLYFLSSGSSKRSIHTVLKSCPDIEVISLNPGEWIEAEWNGCQNIYEDNKPIRMNYVRMIKASKFSPKEESDSLVSLHFGWILGEQIKFIDHRKNGMKTTLLNENDEQFNFKELFQDNEMIEDLSEKIKLVNLC